MAHIVNIDDWEAITVGTNVLAHVFGVSARAVQQMADSQGMPAAKRRGHHHLANCIRWYASRLHDRSTADDSSLAQERRRLLISQREAQDMENAKTRGELLDAEAVSSAVLSWTAIVATAMDSVAPRVAGRVAAIDDPVIVQRLIFDECRSARRSAAAELAAVVDSGRGGEDHQRTARPRRRPVGRRKSGAAAGKPGAGAVAD